MELRRISPTQFREFRKPPTTTRIPPVETPVNTTTRGVRLKGERFVLELAIDGLKKEDQLIEILLTNSMY